MRAPGTADEDATPDPRPDAGPAAPAAGRSRTRPPVEDRKAHRTPHERDESAGSGTSEPREVMRVAHDDAVSDRSATDRSDTTDEVYRRTLRSDTPGEERDGERNRHVAVDVDRDRPPRRDR
jgi:hypothetical protein